MVAPYVPIQDIVPWTQSIAGLNQFIYSTNWTADDSTDILVYSRLSNIPASDLLQLVDPSNYTVQFIGSGNVVQVTFLPLNNPPQYSIVTIMRNTPSQFLNSYTNTNFTPSMLNSDFENLVQVDQQNQLYWQQIVPRYNNSATVNVPIDTILPILGANQFWIKNSTNTAFIPQTYSNSGGSGGVSTAAPLVTWTADSSLSNLFDLGSLASGIIAQTVTLGTSQPYILPIPLEVPNGGTGRTTITPYAVLIGGATDVLPIVSVDDLGSTGQVFTSNGAGAPPSFQTVPTPPAGVGGLINVQVFLTSGTYNPTSGATNALVVCQGGGGGSGGYGSGASGGTGGTGGTTSYGSLCVATGGFGSTSGNSSASVPGNGGSISGATGTIKLPGSAGNAGSGGGTSLDPGGSGGSGIFGSGSGSSQVNGTGTIGGVNTGAGAGGWSQISGVSSYAVSGGGAGAQSWTFISSPDTEVVTIGAGGSAGTAGSSGSAGLAGGSGICIVYEFY